MQTIAHSKIRTLKAALAATACLAGPAALADEAPAAFDNRTNGLVTQPRFDADWPVFGKRATVPTGLGPVFNAESCLQCHQNPIIGGGSQINAVRAGLFDGTQYSDLPGGSMVPDRAINPQIQAHVDSRANVRTFRVSLSALGDGYVEAIADSTLAQIAQGQPGRSGGAVHGEAVMVDVLEAPGVKRVGRFGWKAQHASLLSFSADASRNEMGITNPILPTENTSNGRSVAAFDGVPDPEDRGGDLAAMTEFMRATKAPPRDAALAATAGAQQGEVVFKQIGCDVCHVPAIVTAPAGTAINGGTFTVPAALGGKTIHPYSDFLLHDVGTGDGIVQNGGPSTANKIRTTPLWGLRTRSRLLHDGSALTLQDAISRHQGEASGSIQRFLALSADVKNQVLSFLRSL